MTEHVHTEACAPQPGQLLCIIPGPSHEYKREPAGELWCFGCRARLPHDWVLIGDPPPDPNDPDTFSYYDPQWVKKCSRCRKDRTSFPGTVW